jgi:bifunctional Delta-12/omega-3 fatty acid desaturase
MRKDHNHVPLRHGEYLRSFGEHLQESAHDAPLYVLVRIFLQQTLGWPLYLLYGVTSGPNSTARKVTTGILHKSHFNPFGALFLPHEAKAIILSDIGIAVTVASLVFFGRIFGFGTLFLLYGQPFLWLNQWIVAVTYLQHTHPRVPRYECESWTFVKGATATIDRNMGFIGEFFLHNVIEFHVVHHLFP